jgi:hypothetical protein
MKAFRNAVIGTVMFMCLLAFQNCGKMTIQLDDDGNILSSSADGYIYAISGPSVGVVGDCLPYELTRLHPDGSDALGPATQTEVQVPTQFTGYVFTDANCTQVLTQSPVIDFPATAYFKSSSPFSSDVYVEVNGSPTNAIGLILN